eukprot:Selendium_serpulae@DN2887_c0_g1_i3.p1
MESKHIGALVLSEQQIQDGVKSVAAKLNSKFHKSPTATQAAAQPSTAVAIISVVPGGILFTADLVRQLTFPISMDYISCPHIPGDRNNQSDIVFHENVRLEGKDVIVVDDAIESGGTMKRIIAHLKKNYSMSSLSAAALFVKPGRTEIPVEQFFAYEMENDELLVGYGLSWNTELRNVPFLSKLVQ